MKGCPSKTVLAMGLLFAFLAGTAPACWGATSHPEPVTVSLSFSEPPALGKPVQLTATFKLLEFFTAQFYSPGVTARVVLPEGFEQVGGTLQWRGDMKPGDSHTLTAAVKATRTGQWEVTAEILFEPSRDERYVGNAVLYVSVSDTGATVSNDPPGPTRTPGRKAPTFPPDMTPPPLPRTPSATSPAAANAQSLPMDVRLSFSGPPALGKPVQLSATLRLTDLFYRSVGRDVTARIILSQGFEKVAGDLEWKGDLERGASRTVVATVKAVKTGDWDVAARAEFTPNPGEGYVGEAILYVTVSATAASVSDTPPRPIRTPGPRASQAKPPDFFRPPQLSPIRGELSFSELPTLGKTVQLTASFTLSARYAGDAQDVTARILLYGGFERVDGDLEWRGALSPGASRVLTARVKATQTGNWSVAALSEFQLSPAGKPATSLDALYVAVTEQGATVSDRYSPPGGTPGAAPPATPSRTPLAGSPAKGSQSVAPRTPMAGWLAEVPPQSPRDRGHGVQAAPASFTNPLVVRGVAKVHITDKNNPPYDMSTSQPLVWGGVYIYTGQNANLAQWTASGYTGPAWSDAAGRNLDPGEFYIVIENPHLQIVDVAIRSKGAYADVVDESFNTYDYLTTN